jgi:hypothetical protein
MPHHTLQRTASQDEQAFLRERLARAPTTASRWRQGAASALVTWAVSLLGFVVVWLITAGLARRFAHIDYGLHSTAAPWLLSTATLLCATYAIGSSVLWVQRWKDYRPSLVTDIAVAQVIEEHYAFDAIQRFQEPEHGGLIYFLRTTEGRVLTLYDHESSDLGAQEGDPLGSTFKPMSRLVMVRAPQTGWVISTNFSGEQLDPGDPIELAASHKRWPETEEYCSIPWAELESVLGPGS